MLCKPATIAACVPASEGTQNAGTYNTSAKWLYLSPATSLCRDGLFIAYKQIKTSKVRDESLPDIFHPLSPVIFWMGWGKYKHYAFLDIFIYVSYTALHGISLEILVNNFGISILLQFPTNMLQLCRNLSFMLSICHLFA